MRLNRIRSVSKSHVLWQDSRINGASVGADSTL